MRTITGVEKEKRGKARQDKIDGSIPSVEELKTRVLLTVGVLCDCIYVTFFSRPHPQTNFNDQHRLGLVLKDIGLSRHLDHG